jgi:hypothetical protein
VAARGTYNKRKQNVQKEQKGKNVTEKHHVEKRKCERKAELQIRTTRKDDDKEVESL